MVKYNSDYNSKRYVHPYVHSSNTHNNQDMEATLSILSTEEWIKKRWCNYTMESYSATKKDGIMTFSATWVQLEIIILCEVSQEEKDKHYMISLVSGI